MIITALTFHLYYLCYHANTCTSVTYLKWCITCEWVFIKLRKVHWKNSTDTHDIEATQCWSGSW